MFISSSIDEGAKGVRKGFRLYPILLLYKILLELGKATGKYSISMTEYRYLVATTQKYEQFLAEQGTLYGERIIREEYHAELEMK